MSPNDRGRIQSAVEQLDRLAKLPLAKRTPVVARLTGIVLPQQGKSTPVAELPKRPDCPISLREPVPVVLGIANECLDAATLVLGHGDLECSAHLRSNSE
jgi:hypothetical protein